MKIPIALTIAALALVFSSCSSIVRSGVTRFHKLPAIAENKTFEVWADKHQKDSLEFQMYAQMVSKKLQAYGWRESSSNPDYSVLMTYGIDGGQTFSGSMPIYGQTGGGYSNSSGSIYGSNGHIANYSGSTYSPATFGQVGSIPYTATLYKRYLYLGIVNKKASTREKLDIVFEGRAVSKGPSADITLVMPKIVDALFKHFPGQSGKSEVVELPLRN